MSSFPFGSNWNFRHDSQLAHSEIHHSQFQTIAGITSTMKIVMYAIWCVVAVTPTAGQGCNSTLPPLPEDVENAKAQIISLSKSNLDRWGDPVIQSLINEQAAILENWFVQNRPDNEIELTTGPWFAAWYEDTSFFPSNFLFSADRNNTYQVVRNGFYYNVAKFDVGAIFRRRPWTNYLKGEFTIKDPKTDSSCGEKRRNIIDLRFTRTSLKRGFVPTDSSLPGYIDALDRGDIRRGALGFRFRGGTTGDLWNLFVDEDLRVSYGIDDGSAVDEGGLFVLTRQQFVNG